MSKIIVHIDGVSEHTAIGCVYQVIGKGLFSDREGGRYCHSSTYVNALTNERTIVIASKEEDTHTFTVRKDG